MKTFATIVISVCLAGGIARAGNIAGRVHAEGKPGTEQDAQSGNYASRALKFAERIDYSQMRDFIVYIEGPLTNGKPASAPATVQVTTQKISQKQATFAPHVLPVMTGTTVEWPNKDDIYHNVYSVSDAAQFDLGLYKDPEVAKTTFDKAGRVDVFCSIHANMHCVVLVLDSPWFAATNEKGGYTITNVPPGTYRVKAWHERMPPQVQEVIVPEKGDVKADFTLGITGLPKK